MNVSGTRVVLLHALVLEVGLKIRSSPTQYSRKVNMGDHAVCGVGMGGTIFYPRPIRF